MQMNRFFTIIGACVMTVAAMAMRTSTEMGVFSGTVTIDGIAYTNENIYLFPGTESNTVTCVAGDIVRVNVPLSAISLSAQPTNKNYAFTNGGFEGNWSGNEPQGWHSFVSATGSMASFVNGSTGQFTQSTDTRPGSAGTHSARIQSKYTFGVKANGNCTNGRINAGSMTATEASANYNFSDPSSTGYNTPFAGTPDSLVFWAKYIPADQKPSNSSNKARAHAVITTNARYQDPEATNYDAVKVAEATLNYSANSSMGWQRLAVPFVYSSVSPQNAAYVLITFTTNATQGGGTTSSSKVDDIYLDDVEMIYNYALKSAKLNGQTLSFTNGKATVELPFSENYEWNVSTNGKGAKVFVGYDAQTYKACLYIAANNYAQGKKYSVYTVQMTEPDPIIPEKPTTYYSYSASTCANMPYSDELFTGLTEAGEYTQTLTNTQGGDSIVTLTLTILPTYLVETEIYLTEGDTTWRGRTFSGLTPSDEPYVYYDSLLTVSQCDSVYMLRLYVTTTPRTYGAYTAHVCDGDSVEFEGVYYASAFEGEILLAQKNMYGGDSVVLLTVEVVPNYTIEEYMTITQGTQKYWEDIPLKSLAPGTMTLRVNYYSIDDCDSIRILHLTVLSTSAPQEGADTVSYADVYGRYDGDLTIGGERQGNHSIFLIPGAKDSTVTFVLPDFSYNGGRLGHIVLPNIPMNTFGQLLLEGRTLYLDTIHERATITMLNGWKESGVTYYSIVSPSQAQVVLFIEAPSLPEGILVLFQGKAVKEENYALVNGGFEGNWTNSEPYGWHSFGTATGDMADFVKANTHQFVPSMQVRPGSDGTQSAIITSNIVLGVKANGNCTNGQINAGSTTATDEARNYNFSDPSNPGFNTPFHGRPDTMVFWAKYMPADHDVTNIVNKARLNAVITTDARYQDPEEADTYSQVKIGAATMNYSATADMGWQRIAVPFTYYAKTKDQRPAYILTTFTTNSQPGGGSSYSTGDNLHKRNVLDTVYLDDAQVVYNKALNKLYIGTEAVTFEDHIAHVPGLYCDDCDSYKALSSGVSAKTFIGFDEAHRCVYVYVIADDYTQTKAYNIYRIEFEDSMTDDLKPIDQTERIENTPVQQTLYRKILHNGQLLIMRDGQEVFDILGRKIN